MTAANVTAIVILTLLAVVLFDFARAYFKSRKTGWGRLLDAGRGSATILWSQLVFAVGAIAAGFNQILDWVCQVIGAPGADDAIKSAVQQVVTAERVGLALAIVGIITIIARMRTLGK